MHSKIYRYDNGDSINARSKCYHTFLRRRQLVKEAVDSVLLQTFKDYEIIVVMMVHLKI